MKTFDWYKFYDNTHRLYRSIIRSIIRNPDDIDDILQNTYLSLYEKASNYDNDALFQIGASTARRKAIDFYRYTKKRPCYCQEIEDKFEDDLDSKETLEEAISILGSYDNAKYILLFSQGYKYREIAEMFDIGIGQVKSKIHRLRNKLKESDLQFP